MDRRCTIFVDESGCKMGNLRKKYARRIKYKNDTTGHSEGKMIHFPRSTNNERRQTVLMGIDTAGVSACEIIYRGNAKVFGAFIDKLLAYIDNRKMTPNVRTKKIK